MSPLWRRTNRWLSWFHRWAGVALCMLFAVWFASGAVLHFVGFPALAIEDEHAASEIIDPAQIQIGPSAALSRIPLAQELRLVSVAGRPVYIVKDKGVWTSVAADTGDLLPALSPDFAQRVAESFSRVPAAAVSGPIDYDQWIVHQHFDQYRPLYRVRLKDRDRTDLYVSSRTGEVVQRTRFRERAWNWPGAVIHWIYFTPLRKSWSAWNQTVWWLSLMALLSSAAGTWLGIWRMLSNRAAGRPGLSPFRGWMRWHHLIGIFASIIVVGWILSGWLSMDHGRLFSHADPTHEQTDHLSGLSLAGIAQAATPGTVKEVSPATSISFNAIAGHPFVTAYGPSTARPRVLFLDQVSPTLQASLPNILLAEGVMKVWPIGVQPARSAASDELYRLAESTGDSAAAFTAGDLRVYVDRYTGRFLAVMDASRRIYAWIYYALHTLQFPGLLDHPQVRTVLVLALLAAGFAFSITGVVLSVIRLRREVA